MNKKFPILIFILALVAACGGKSDGGSSSRSPASASEVAEAAPGTYYAVLRPVNFQANGFIAYGAANFTVKGTQLIVSTSMDDDQAVTHRQTLHAGSRCPNASDDVNGDGFVDYNEAMAVVGSAIMPLDNDINTKDAGAGVYPRGPGMTYNKTGVLAKILADGPEFGLEGKVVLVHGTAPRAEFPTSLAAFNGEPANLSLPVVCGVLKKI